MLYADNIVLCDPSAEGLQKLSDISHTYGCNHDNEFNTSKFGVIYIDSRRKAGNAKSMTIGVTFESCYLFLIPWTYIIKHYLLLSLNQHVAVCKLQVAIIARSSGEMSQTVRID